MTTEMLIIDTVLAVFPCLLAAALGLSLFFLARHVNAMRTCPAGLAPVYGVERYRPMLRLLDERDFEYLAGAGCGAAEIRQAKAGRRAIFRRYLRSLVKDYSRLLAGLRMRILMSDVDRPDLLRVIAISRFRFLQSLLRIEISLALHAAGIGRVDVSGLVSAVEALRAVSAGFAEAAA